MCSNNLFRQASLSTRITVSFLLLAFVTAGSLGIGMYRVILFVERNLISQQLEEQLVRYLQYPDYRSFIDNDPDYLFFSQPLTSPLVLQVPDWVANLRSGFHEAQHNERYYFSWVKNLHDHRYYLLYDQTAFERREHQVFLYIFLAFAACMVLAFFLARLIARQISTPIHSLAATVNALSTEPGTDTELPAMTNQFDSSPEVHQLAQAFFTVFRQYQQAIARERHFSADLSHELRTPIMVISSCCEVLLADPALSPVTQARLTAISESADRMRLIVQTLLMLLRHQSGQALDLPHKPLAEIMTGLENHWRTRIEHRGLEFSVRANHLPAGACQVPAIIVELIADNLLRNALEHTTEGSIELSLNPDSFCIRDTGTGMTPEQVITALNAFSSAKASSDNNHLGIGLSLASRLCNIQGWHLEIQSLPEEGTRVCIYWNAQA